MLARRFAAEREHHVFGESCGYGTGYLDLLRVKHAGDICQALGLRLRKPNATVHMANMEVSCEDVKKFLKTPSTFKNAMTLFKGAVTVHRRFQARDGGDMLISEMQLYRQLDFMLSDTLIGASNRDPAATQASLMNRVDLGAKLREQRGR